MPAADSELDVLTTNRLVIRIKLVEQEPAPPPPPRLSKSALLIVGVLAAVGLGAWAIGTFRSEPPAARQAPVIAAAPAPKAATPKVTPVPLEVQKQLDAPTAPVNEVIPAAPQSALSTISGTIRVTFRVAIDKQGNVVDTAAEERGPSRYFERLARDAAKKWTFTKATSDERRSMLLKFNFTRFGATAQASAP